MQFNLFSWIREGVRQSVILGVSDAVDAIGSPQVDDPIRERLNQLLQPIALEGAPATAAVAGNAKRKRLGRSLRDFDGAEG
jgi:hypothetical protein